MYYGDTISAISTPIGEGGISIIRISGEAAFNIIEKVFSKNRIKDKIFNISEINSHTLHFGYIFDNNELIDEVIISIFKNPNSYTGEDVIEISSHGSVLVSRKILNTVLKNGVRLAEPGEFTKRAFLNKRIDLAQAEAVADLIKSKTDIAHKSSLQQLEGELSEFVKKTREDIINFTSLVELELDFAEENLEFVPKKELKNKISNLANSIEQIINTYITGKIIRDGINVVIAGRPNSGKSSLFNFLLSSDRAIVSNVSGTTRDYIEENIIINGVLFNLIDTAGIRNTQDEIETEGIKRSFIKIEEADLILYLIDTSNSKTEIIEELNNFNSNLSNTKTLLVFSKSDLAKKDILTKFSKKEGITVSLLKADSIENLRKEMVKKIQITDIRKNYDGIILTNIRHKVCLENVIKSLRESVKSLDANLSGEFISVDLRNALNYLGEITGEVTNEDILRNIFQNFCIGK